MKKASKGDRLSVRLRAIADLVTDGMRVADVGCDHGFLSIELVSSGKCPCALAMDVRTGPLSRAEEHIREAGLSDRIETRLGNGLGAMRPEEADSVVIAGMGGPLMEQIISDSISTCRSMKELILQPQSEIPHFRQYLLENGFSVTEERMVKDAGKIYVLIKVVPHTENGNGGSVTEWSRMELAFGKDLLGRKDPVLREYLLREKRIRENILRDLCGINTVHALKRAAETEEELQIIREGLKIYEGL